MRKLSSLYRLRSPMRAVRALSPMRAVRALYHLCAPYARSITFARRTRALSPLRAVRALYHLCAPYARGRSRTFRAGALLNMHRRSGKAEFLAQAALNEAQICGFQFAAGEQDKRRRLSCGLGPEQDPRLF